MRKYNELNYKEKFYETLRILPYLIAMQAFFWFMGHDRVSWIIMTVILFAIFFVQLIYNYIMWKKDEKKKK